MDLDPRKILKKAVELIALYPPGEGYPMVSVHVGYGTPKRLSGKEPINNHYYIETNDQGGYIIRRGQSASRIPFNVNTIDDFLNMIGDSPITSITISADDGQIYLFSCNQEECPEIKKWASNRILDATKSKLMGNRKKMITSNIIEELKYLPPGQFNRSFPGGDYYREGAARWNSRFGDGTTNYLKSLLK
jgi:hypothetical protein